MMVMVLKDAQDKAFSSRRDKEACEYNPDSNKSPRVRRASTRVRNQSLGIYRTDRQKADPPCDSGGAIAGGRIVRLIDETKKQIASRKSEINQLESFLEELQSVIDQFGRSE
jgi:hypothetical protein